MRHAPANFTQNVAKFNLIFKYETRSNLFEIKEIFNLSTRIVANCNFS